MLRSELREWRTLMPHLNVESLDGLAQNYRRIARPGLPQDVDLTPAQQLELLHAQLNELYDAYQSSLTVVPVMLHHLKREVAHRRQLAARIEGGAAGGGSGGEVNTSYDDNDSSSAGDGDALDGIPASELSHLLRLEMRARDELLSSVAALVPGGTAKTVDDVAAHIDSLTAAAESAAAASLAAERELDRVKSAKVYVR